jgi:hypothetical protein
VVTGSSVHFTGSAGRTINISPDVGIEARDSQGTVIHDTPDCVVAADMAYGGHIYFQNAPNYIASDNETTVSDGTASQVYSGAVVNTSLATSLPSDLTNVNAVLLYIRQEIAVDEQVMTTGAWARGRVYYSMTYNSTASADYNHLSEVEIWSQQSSGDNEQVYHNLGIQVIAPIVYNATTPYLSWFRHFQVIAGTTATGRTISHLAYIYLQGFLV